VQPTRALNRFEVISDYVPAGDQPQAIAELTKRLENGERDVVLLGATGTGKSATTAWLVEQVQRPTLVLAHNKTLAAQLANEFKQLLPNNAVEYFVSYYDYYQPEAYVPQTDTFIEKDSSINEEVERLRYKATMSLLSRRDVIVVSTVSCIYGLGAPAEYLNQSVPLQVGQRIDRDALIRRFVELQYKRNDIDFSRGNFRVKGDTIEIIPVYDELATRIELFGDEIEAIYSLSPLTGEVMGTPSTVAIFPASYYVAPAEQMGRAIEAIEHEAIARVKEFEQQGKLLEAQRIKMRTNFDLEMIRELGFCSGIENYSRHIDNREPGEAPSCLLDYFPEDFLTVIDESHVTVPQIGAMYEGDASRKRTLVDHGFRLPSAMDNRPLRWDEFQQRVGQTVYLSATPGKYELGVSDGAVEQIIRPTGLVDPQIVVKPTKGQIDDLLEQIRVRVAKDERILVTTLTKKMSEELTDFLTEAGVRVRYLHSDVDTLRRVELQGFLRSATSLIQTIGRAARNINGEVHMYADRVTDAMAKAIEETDRRREKQVSYNKSRGVDPQPLRKKIADITDDIMREEADTAQLIAENKGKSGGKLKSGQSASATKGRKGIAGKAYDEILSVVVELEQQMKAAAAELQFELAARIRDEMVELKRELRQMEQAGHVD
jgi:excinuclease ABC subunit B